MQGVLLRQGSGHLQTHPQLLPHRQTALSQARMPHQLRRGTGLLRHITRRHRRLLLRRLPRQEERECRKTHGRQAIRKRRSESTTTHEHQAEDVEGLRESAHVHRCPRLLLRDGLLHSRFRDGQRSGDRPMRHQTWKSRTAAVWRTLQDRILLFGHGVRHDLHRRVPPQVIRRSESLQIRQERHEHHRRGGYNAVLHRIGYYGQ